MGEARLMLAENFRKNMTAVMAERNIKLSHLAEMMGKPSARDWVRRVRKGEVSPSLSTIEKICNALGVDPIAMLED